MAQLKVKQISDFVSAVESKVNSIVGTANVSAISVAKSEAIASAEAKDVLRASTAVVNISTAKSEAIASAEAKDVLRASTAVVNISTAKSEAIASASTADIVILSSAKKYADDQDVLALSSAKAYSDIQRDRIDALLLNSDEALDTFAEIKSFVDGLDTADVAGLSAALSTAVSNDEVHAAGISANSTAIANLDLDFSGDFDALGSADAAYDAAVAESTRLGDLAYDRLGDAGLAEGNAKKYTDDSINALGSAAGNATEDFATAAQGLLADSALQPGEAFGDLSLEVTKVELNQLSGVSLGDIVTYNYTRVTTDISNSISTEVTNRNTAISNAITTEVTNRNTAITTAIDALDLDLQTQINALSGVSSDEVVATFDSATAFSTTVQFALNGHLVVFVNGLQIHEAAEGIDGWRSVNGRNFTVEGLGYELEGDDHIIVSGTVA